MQIVIKCSVVHNTTSKSKLWSSVHSNKLIASRIPVILAYLTVAAIAGMNFSRYSSSPICLLILNIKGMDKIQIKENNLV